MASGIYNRAKANWFNKVVDLEADIIHVALMATGHAFDAAHNTWSQVVVNEMAGTGYDAGGKALANKGVTQAATTKWDADDIVWTVATFTAFHAVIYDNDLAGDDLICSIDFGGGKSVSGGTFTIQWDAAGIITLT